MAVLITGGAGYIGSHTVLCLLEQGYKVVVLDNYYNASPESLHRVKKITGIDFVCYDGDVRDRALLKKIFSKHEIDSVIHFAGLKSVGESVREPLTYYDNNVSGSVVLLQEMNNFNVKKFIFSSSATVYGQPESVPLSECSRIGGTTNAYGTSKLMVEQILQDMAKAIPDFDITILRYFNPVGAHKSGLIGEDPNGIPSNLVPYISQVAVGKLQQVSVYGNDFLTKDGTGVRDYIHVMDLAEGHIAALKQLASCGCKIYNLGTGIGYSVLDLINAYERAIERPIPYVFAARRAGDIAECWSDPTLALKELNWSATRNLDDMLKDSWNWQRMNPNGYES
ncbi:UDP-glucose 4-epimerase GalE [Cedecea neteri]|uniref:UDP-glucose 4-epimerase GalE n=1 Tax=Cedecea neteri TaxID=158822 RepID=UPI002AA918E4|nr:UDP-glucose 4-epimerase GalE [Cedecea neteri]WPU24680.1 UDP-glucose 4-epimerase GalE [Cedecea neteri]